MRGNLVCDICAFIPCNAGLTEEVVFHEGGLSKEVLLYYPKLGNFHDHANLKFIN